jgi:hypothetical protein
MHIEVWDKAYTQTEIAVPSFMRFQRRPDAGASRRIYRTGQRIGG